MDNRKHRRFLSRVLSLLLIAVLLAPPASAKTVHEETRSVTLRVGQTTSLTNPAGSAGMAMHAYSWSAKGRDVVSETHATNSSVCSVTALKPGRAIVVGYLDGCYAVQKTSSSYSSWSHSVNNYTYTSYTENNNYTYRYQITVLNADGSQPDGPGFAQLQAEMEKEAAEAAENLKFTSSGKCGKNVYYYLDDGVLTISGEGDMYVYDKYSITPWYVDSVEYVVIEEGVTSVGPYAFYRTGGFETIRGVSIADSVKTIGQGAFLNCDNLESVFFGSGLESIGESAFSSCNKLSSIDLPESLRSIGESAFQYCYAIEQLFIPRSVSEIGKYAFSDCKALKAAVLLGPLTSLPPIFAYDANLAFLYLPGSISYVSATAFSLSSKSGLEIRYEGTESQWAKAIYDPAGYRRLPADCTVYCDSPLPTGLWAVGTESGSVSLDIYVAPEDGVSLACLAQYDGKGRRTDIRLLPMEAGRLNRLRFDGMQGGRLLLLNDDLVPQYSAMTISP